MLSRIVNQISTKNPMICRSFSANIIRKLHSNSFQSNKLLKVSQNQRDFLVNILSYQ